MPQVGHADLKIKSCSFKLKILLSSENFLGDQQIFVESKTFIFHVLQNFFDNINRNKITFFLFTFFMFAIERDLHM